MAREREGETDLRVAAEERYLNYALSVITSRALPDVRDGLKPVQRRILFAMYQNLRLGAGAKPRKSAQIVGEVLGKYHPHGDTAAYDAMVRMAQAFSLRYPLVHGEGNFGSLDGDGAAAYRYTEARLTALAEAMLVDLAAETVDWRDNYDATLEEPVVLPSRVPQLLINGSTGIAVGMATNVPPHNLREVVAALLALIDEPKLAVSDLLKHVKGPDFPTGGELVSSRAEIRAVYETGQGSLRLRGTFEIETLPRGRRQLVVTSIPYAITKTAIVEQIAAQIISRKLPLLVDVRDESTADVRVVLELKPEADPDAAMAYLYRHTDLQANIGVNLTCLLPSGSGGPARPARVSLLQICRHFLDFRMDIVTRRLMLEKAQLERRLHILEGFLALFADLDKAIRLIRAAESRADANAKLCKGFGIDAEQADAILEMRLYQLARLERVKLEDEHRERSKRLAEVERLLKRPAERWKMIRAELEEVATIHGDARRTRLNVRGVAELAYDPEAYVVHEEATVLLSRDGWIRRVRELRDPSAARLREGDALAAVHMGTTRDRLALFSSRGTVFVLPVRDVPATTGYGEPVQSFFRFADRETVVTSMLLAQPTASTPEAAPPGRPQGELFAGGKPALELTEETRPLLVVSARGYGFRTLPDLSETNRAGRRLARVGEGDELITIGEITGDTVVCLMASGRGLRFGLEEVAELAGTGRGVILCRPEADDRVIGAAAVPAGARVRIQLEEGERLVPVADFPEMRRGGKGHKVVKRGRATGLSVGEATGR